MGLRVFSVKRDGSYSEVPARKESFFEDNGAYLIIDRVERRIYVYRKDGIPSSLAYWAGRAATNLNTRKGSKYKVINIEQEERDRILPELIEKLEEAAYSEPFTTTKTDLGGSAYVYGEKIVPATQTISKTTSEIKYEKGLPETKPKQESNQMMRGSETYDFEEVAKTLASKILFDSNIEHMKKVEKPPRNKLRKELIKKIDGLLDKMY
ncbi:MAG: hypothetical protein KAU62_17415 [Candidatus Heimdallarchaeota archaeon]|nr:hypothetical protein [Candidatus Heimdallarchaeota archaeon]MCG3257888.1 hypothetical protein [Candidatus Heimdallarchaeota archaeon]MCK4612939.1 hypothetical protein [Candidatus Heimdallarchaeota archaeon]